MLLNLLSNAIKYNRPGGRVSSSLRDKAGWLVRLSITDTGPGISPEGLARCSCPSSGWARSSAGGGHGTGPGGVEAVGGSDGRRLGAESRVGVGSTFWVELPSPPESPATDANGTGSHSNLAANSEQAVAATLLYIEDNASNLQVIQTVLRRLRPHWRLLFEKTAKAA